MAAIVCVAPLLVIISREHSSCLCCRGYCFVTIVISKRGDSDFDISYLFSFLLVVLMYRACFFSPPLDGSFPVVWNVNSLRHIFPSYTSCWSPTLRPCGGFTPYVAMINACMYLPKTDLIEKLKIQKQSVAPYKEVILLINFWLIPLMVLSIHSPF